MQKSIKKSLCVLLSILMIVGVFAIVPFTAGAATASYVKVTSEPDDWSGDYLIVYEDEDGSTAFNGSSNDLNSSGNYIDVTISGDKIVSNASTNAAKVTIAQIDGGYSIATANGTYIGGASGLNKMDYRDEAILNTISLEDDSAKIVSNTSTLRFNTSWSGFRYYKTMSQQPVQLFKLTGGSAPTYTVTWKNWDGSVLETDENVAKGSTPTYDGEAPAKAADAQNTYTFAAWDDGTTTYVLGVDDLPAVTADVTYTAVFTAETNTYKVTWKNWDGNELKVDENVPYGTVPEYEGTDPTKPNDENYTYTFAGWTPEVVAVAGDAEYTAVFNAVENVGKTGLDGDYYYINGVKVGSYYGLVMDNGNYYYVDNYAKIIKNKAKFLNNTNGLTFADGTPISKATYSFDADGKMIIPNGLVDDYYYINGVRVGSYYGLIQVDGDYYYVDNYAKIVKNKTKFLNTTNGLTFANGTPIPKATYSFDADGKMIIPNGLVGDNYYVNGVKLAPYYGLVKDGNDYYYVDANAKIVRSKRKYLTTTNDLTFPDGTPIPHKYFEFDADGKMIF